MNILKVYYMNDEQKNVVVRIMDARYDAFYATGDIYVTLEPAEARILEVHVPDGHILYLKKWPAMILVSSVDPTVLSQQNQQPLDQDVL